MTSERDKNGRSVIRFGPKDKAALVTVALMALGGFINQVRLNQVMADHIADEYIHQPSRDEVFEARLDAIQRSLERLEDRLEASE